MDTQANCQHRRQALGPEAVGVGRCFIMSRAQTRPLPDPEWRPRDAVWQFGGHRGAASGELNRPPWTAFASRSLLPPTRAGGHTRSRSPAPEPATSQRQPQDSPGHRLMDSAQNFAPSRFVLLELWTFRPDIALPNIKAKLPENPRNSLLSGQNALLING